MVSRIGGIGIEGEDMILIKGIMIIMIGDMVDHMVDMDIKNRICALLIVIYLIMVNSLTIMVDTITLIIILTIIMVHLLLSMSEMKMTRKKRLNPKAYASIAGKLNKNLTVEREHFNREEK